MVNKDKINMKIVQTWNIMINKVKIAIIETAWAWMKDKVKE